jgi:nucleotide-binding universal stress UspA family protein
VTGAGGNGLWKILAPVDLSCAEAEKWVEYALALAAGLRGDLTLLSVIDRQRFERGWRHSWTANAFGQAWPDIDIHRVVLPGSPAEAISVYADQIRADVILVPAQYHARRWLRKYPLAPSVAALTPRCLWTIPAHAQLWTSEYSPRVACMMRLDGGDERLLAVAQSVLKRCGG